MPETDVIGGCMFGPAHQRRDGGADLDADRIALRRKDARVGRAVGCDLAGLVLVAIQAVDTNRVERLKVNAPASP